MNKDLLNEDELNKEMAFAFHSWKHENAITKIFFNYLREISNELHSQIVNNAESPASADQKLHIYYSCCAKLRLITEILELNLEDIQEWSKK